MTSKHRYELLHAIDRLADAATARDLRRVEARRRDAKALVALFVRDEPEHVCPDCRTAFKTAERLAEHRYHVHGGPEPDHWREDEA